jgi:hypothetical protein
MFEQLREWFTHQRAWRTEHEAAWAPAKLKGPDQLTSFQHQCSEALAEAVPGLSFERETGQRELYLVAHLPRTKSQVFVYEDGSNIHEAGRDFIAEKWDYKTPADLIAAVVAEAKRRVAI